MGEHSVAAQFAVAVVGFERPIPVEEIAVVEIHPELADYIGRTLTLTLSDSP